MFSMMFPGFPCLFRDVSVSFSHPKRTRPPRSAARLGGSATRVLLDDAIEYSWSAFLSEAASVKGRLKQGAGDF